MSRDLLDNPLGTDGFEFVEFTGPDPQAIARQFVAMGFTAVAKHRSKNVVRYRQGDISFCGHAIECRINAENPNTFLPCPGRVTDYHAPGGLGVRVDSALYHGYEVPSYYDSLISKLIVHGKSRNESLMRLRRALEEYVIGGIETTIPLHQRVAVATDFIDGDYDVHWLERFVRDRA